MRRWSAEPWNLPSPLTLAQVIIAAVDDTGPATVLILGGRSEIGVELARRLAPGAVVVLASHGPLVSSLVAEHGPIDTAVLAFGILGDQARAETDAAHAVAVVHTDYVAQVSLLTHLAAAMRVAGRGSLVVFSSIAGARVRRANYVYGSAKAGLDGFASGLADALHGTGVRVLIARPGFVIGRMTQGMTPAPLPSTPAQVAHATARALAKGRHTVWIPWALGPASRVMRLLPQFVWRRMPR